jgi:hypothetical protein
VWHVLLTGSNSPKDVEEHNLLGELDNISSLIADCDVMAKDSSLERRQNLEDILTLYCRRKDIDYNSVYCNILSPLICSYNSFTKELASTCFDALASEFCPLLSMKAPAFEMALDSVHTRLRLLVFYHSPAVAQHLDRVLPGWEGSVSIGNYSIVFVYLGLLYSSF